jgi:hypothetical protein
MLVMIKKLCRCCGKIPPKGFFPSRARRYDWLCPRCCMNQANERRAIKDATA